MGGAAVVYGASSLPGAVFYSLTLSSVLELGMSSGQMWPTLVVT